MIEPSAWAAIGAAASPSFSVDGQTIFHLRGAGLPQIWSMRRDGSDPRQLTDTNEKTAQLRRAPKDDRLLWGIDAGGDERQQLWLLEPGAEPVALSSTPAANFDLGAFSPDGRRIAFAANDRDEACFDVVVMDLATGTRERLLEGPGSRSVTNWNGSRLLVIEDRSSGDQSLWVIDVDTHAAREIPRAGLVRYASARFSKDGASILVITDQGGADFMRLCEIDPDIGAVKIVFAPEGHDVEAWSLSPDGALLATVENDRGYGMLRVGRFGGEREPVKGFSDGIVADLAWAPDSSALAFSAQSPVAPPGLYIWDAETRRWPRYGVPIRKLKPALIQPN